MKTFRGSGVRFAAMLITATCFSGGPAAADDDLRRGTSMVSSVDVVGKRITVDDEDYRVGENCRIQRQDGSHAELADIRTPTRRSGELTAIDAVDFIRFEARKRRELWYMETIVILAEPAR